MEELFNGNIIFIFFFSMLAIYNYSNLREYQRIAIMYITVYSLGFVNVVQTNTAIFLLILTMFCFLEILTEDEKKFKIIVNPVYKVLDCLYLSFFQYAFLEVLLAIILCDKKLLPFKGSGMFYKILSVVVIIIAIINTLQQKYVVSSFKEMYKIFGEFPINKVEFNEKLKDACNILVSIEDRTYYMRKGYTILSFDAIIITLKDKLKNKGLRYKCHYTYKTGTKFVKNIFSKDRGYSTIPMQLIRALGIKRGYNYKFRRKIFEFLYSRMFFEGIKRMFNEDKVSKREYIKDYYLYIYFHKVNTFLGDATFSKFLNAFDMQYNNKNVKDIYDCSNEGIFIACMGLSKRADKIDEENIDYYLNMIPDVLLNRDEICEMVSNMMDKPYNGNYLQ